MTRAPNNHGHEGKQTARTRCKLGEGTHSALISMTWIVIQLGPRVSVAVRILQFQVGVATLTLPFQTEFSSQLLLPSLPPPLATLPDSESNERNDEDEASEEDVRPPAQNLGLKFFLLLALGNG